MNVQDTVRDSLLEYPMLFCNALDVYNHLFCVIGNGYEWRDGELIELSKKSRKRPLTVKKAIKTIIERKKKSDVLETIKWIILEDHNKEEGKEIKPIGEELLERMICLEFDDIQDSVLLDLDIDKRCKDFSAYTSEHKPYGKVMHRLYGFDKNKVQRWKAYPLIIEYSYLCNFPEDIKADWAVAIDWMCWKLSDLMNSNELEILGHDHANEDTIARDKEEFVKCLEKAKANLTSIVEYHTKKAEFPSNIFSDTIQSRRWLDIWNSRNKKERYIK